jgi:hypothetical protein
MTGFQTSGGSNRLPDLAGRSWNCHSPGYAPERSFGLS